MQLFDFEQSGNCYKARLFLALLGKDYDRHTVDLTRGEERHPDYLRLNPRGQVPALVDGPIIVWDSMAILVYLAREYGDASWLPLEPEKMAKVMQWLAVSENELLYGLARARAIKRFQRPWNLEDALALSGKGLHILEQALQEQIFLAASHPTIADIACYPYVALAPQADLSLENYPAIQAWLGRIQGLPAYIPLPEL